MWVSIGQVGAALLVIQLVLLASVPVSSSPQLTASFSSSLNDQTVRGDSASNNIRRVLQGSEQKEERKNAMKTAKVFPQRLALETYAQSLVPEKDYNATNWRPLFNSRSATDFFHGYIKKLSNIYKENMATVNFALVGACDGISDPTIKHFFNKNDHFLGVFVEPVSINHRELVKYLEDERVIDRSYVIRAACTQKCKEPTISIERPLYEEKNASLPHWMRRQIASIVPSHRNHARKEWVIEEVRCVTADDIVLEWSAVVKERLDKQNGVQVDTSVSKNKPVRKRRIHVLKIDVEGHDYDVLMSFLKDEIPVNDLPLLICFEAKSIGPKYPAAKEHMEKRGYVVTPFGQDGFALLKGDTIMQGLTAPKERRRKKQQNSLEERSSAGDASISSF